MSKVVVYTDNESGLEYQLDTNTVIGRAPQAAIQIVVEGVSRAHAEIVNRGAAFVLKDLESINGTFVNGKRVRQQVLVDGDEIAIGQARILFMDRAIDQNIGKTIKGYRILENIGTGGMGKVYKARQLSMRREVALKILNPELTENRSYITQFVNEARTAGRLNHPNLVQVYEVGESDGLYFFSMEYVIGINLYARLNQTGKILIDRALDIILSVSHALKHAHDSGIIHQDVKPHNIMITPDGTVKLADLGIARAIDAVAGEGAKKLALGTPHYMSPEQAKREKVDARTDIYSLGATFFHLITGRPPFAGDSALAIIAKHISQPLPSPKKFDITIPEPVCKIIQRMMAKNVAERYANMDAVIAALETLKDTGTAKPGEAVVERKRAITAMQTQTKGKSARRMRRMRSRSKSNSLSSGLIVLALFVIIGLLIAHSLYSQKPASSDSSTLPFNKRAPKLTKFDPITTPKTRVPDAKIKMFEEIDRKAKALEAEGQYREAMESYQDFNPKTAPPALLSRLLKAQSEITAHADEAMAPLIKQARRYHVNGASTAALDLLRRIRTNDISKTRIEEARSIETSILSSLAANERQKLLEMAAKLDTRAFEESAQMLEKYLGTEWEQEFRALSVMAEGTSQLSEKLVGIIRTTPRKKISFGPDGFGADGQPIYVVGAAAYGLELKSGSDRVEWTWADISHEHVAALYKLCKPKLNAADHFALAAFLVARNAPSGMEEINTASQDPEFKDRAGWLLWYLSRKQNAPVRSVTQPDADTSRAMPVQDRTWRFNTINIAEGCQVAQGRWELEGGCLVNREEPNTEAALRFESGNASENFRVQVILKAHTVNTRVTISCVRPGANPENFGCGIDSKHITVFVNILGSEGSRMEQRPFELTLGQEYSIEMEKQGTGFNVRIDGKAMANISSASLAGFSGPVEIRVTSGSLSIKEVKVQNLK